MKKTLTRMLSVLIAVCCVFSLMAPAFAATVADATIDTSKTGSITLYKYDYTNSYKDGMWNNENEDEKYQSTGVEDKDGVNDALGGSPSHTLGNDQISNGYAIAGVEFTYLMVGELYTYSEVDANGVAQVALLYGFAADDKVLEILKLDANDAYTVIGSKNYYESDTLVAALNAALAADPTGTRNAMEEYIVEDGTAMPLTDADGKSSVSGLPVGLYLLVETAVPEMVTSTTAPFFLSIPTTSVNGTNATDGGHRWIYDLVIYPKNETGIVTLEKEVKEHGNDEEFSHNATASTGDVVDYRITSTLPTITSSSTYLSSYTFVDTLAGALTYNQDQDVVLLWYSDKDCENLVNTWNVQDGKYKVTYGADNTMKIEMTAAGLAEINTAVDSCNNLHNPDPNVDTTKYAGYSNYTLRIVYSAKLNSDDSFTYGDAGNDNEVTLTWSRTSETYYDVLKDDCHVYSYGINLEKTFSDVDNATAESKGLYDHVKFKLQNTTDGYYVVAKLDLNNGYYYVTGTTANEEEGSAFEPVTTNKGTSAEKYGQIVIKGLEDDTYVLTEIETANGYILMKNDITVVITATDDANRPCNVYNEDNKGLTQNDGRYDEDGIVNDVDEQTNIPQVQLAHNMLTASATVDGNAVVMINDTDASGADTGSTNAAAPVSVLNNAGMPIPETGDTTMMILTVFGSIMIICTAALIFVVARSKKRENA